MSLVCSMNPCMSTHVIKFRKYLLYQIYSTASIVTDLVKKSPCLLQNMWAHSRVHNNCPPLVSTLNHVTPFQTLTPCLFYTHLNILPLVPKYFLLPSWQDFSSNMRATSPVSGMYQSRWQHKLLRQYKIRNKTKFNISVFTFLNRETWKLFKTVQ